MPYEKIVHEKDIARLKDDVKKARARKLKGRPKKAVSRRFPTGKLPTRSWGSVNAAARDELLAADAWEVMILLRASRQDALSTRVEERRTALS